MRDGLGNTVKCLTALECLKRPYRNQILSAKAVFDFCNENIKGIKFFFPTKEKNQKYKRNSYQTLWESIYHPRYPKFSTNLQHLTITPLDWKKKCSEDSSFFKEHKFSEDEVHQSFNIQISSYVAVAYEEAWWLGTIREINEAKRM